MKKILIALIATIFLLTSLALGAPSDSPQISGDKFAEVTGFPGNLPDGWTFSKLNNTNYDIQNPHDSKLSIRVMEITNPRFQNSSPNEILEAFVANLEATGPEFTLILKGPFDLPNPSISKGAFALHSSWINSKDAYHMMEFIQFKGKTYGMFSGHPLRKELTNHRIAFQKAIFKLAY